MWIIKTLFILVIMSNCNNTSTLSKQTKYHVSLTFCRMRSAVAQKFSNYYPWMNKINESIILSGLPLRAHKKKILELQKTTGKEVRILSLIENFEQNSSFVNKPLCTKDYQEMGLQRVIIETEDFKPLGMETFKKAISVLEQNAKDGALTIVHCKAGVGRSASVVAAWLILNDNKNNINLKPDQVRALVKTYVKKLKYIRHHVNLRREQQEALAIYLTQTLNL